MGIKVCGWRVLIKPLAIEEVDETYKKVKDSGIIIPELSELNREKEAITTGHVVQIGDNCWSNDVPWAKVGDLIAFSKWAGKNVTDPETDVTYKILNDEDVICVLTGGRNE